MAQTGFTPIQIYSSSTTGNTPAAADLLNSSGGSELAINIFDGKLFYKDNAGAVQVIGWKIVPVSAGGTGQTSYTDGQLLIGNSTGNTLAKSTLTAGSGITITNGAGAITISATGGTGTVTSVAALTLGTTGTDLSSTVATGTTTPVITLNVPTASATNRGALSAADWTTFNNKTSNTGTVTSVAASVPAFLSISGSPITTSGTLAITYSGTALPVANGGTNATSASITAFNNITGYSATGATGTTSTNLVFSTSPTLITPTLGVATATSINKMVITAPATSSTLAIADGKTHTVNNSIALSGTDSTTMTFPTTSATIARTDAAQTFTGNQTLATGNLVQGTAAKGINFTANTSAAGMTSQLLNWYEEGTWTPTFTGWTTAPTVYYATYERIGRQVTIHLYASGGAVAYSSIGGLPFTSGNQGASVTAVRVSQYDVAFYGTVGAGVTAIQSVNEIGALAGNNWCFSFSYGT